MNNDLLKRAKELLATQKSTGIKTAVPDNVQAIVSKGNVVAKIVDGKWISDDKVIADMLNNDLKLRFIWGAIYTPNTYAEMANRAAKLLDGKVDYVIELPYEEGAIY
jgi:butyrate kinase